MSSSFTRFVALTVLSQIIISHASNVTCDYGWFTTSSNPNSSYNGQCVFMCSQHNSNNPTEVLYSDLSFATIKDECWSVQNSNCSSLSDLVWDDYCNCPYCRCNKPPGYTEINNRKSYFEQECNECTCNIKNNQNETGWECNQQYQVRTIEDWDQYSCNNTLITCTDPFSNIYSPGQGYWQHNSIDPSCQTYCYCNYDGTIDCENSYANILTSSNSRLTYEFKSNCEWNVAGCMNDVTLMFNESSYCQCPRCRCPTGKVLNDKWHIEYTEPISSAFDDDPNDRTSCRECICVDNGNGLNQDCQYQNDYENGTESCPMTYLNCSDGNGANATRADANSGSGLTTRQCYGQDRKYCGWDYQIDYDDYDWGCGHSMGCEAFTAINNNSVTSDCVHLNFNISGTSICDDYLFGLDEYKYCCKGDHCNDMDIDTSLCREDSYINKWYGDFFNCKYGAIHTQFFCSDVDEYTCTDIELLGTSYMGCECTAYSEIYHRVSDWGKQWLTKDIQRRFASLHNWANHFGCNATWTCNLTATGLISLNGEVQSPQPTEFPTASPTLNTLSPTDSPTIITINPTISPSTKSPTNIPTITPSNNPTNIPTVTPSNNPTFNPSNNPSITPTKYPTNNPSFIPTSNPTNGPTDMPTNIPTENPSNLPTVAPTSVSINPTISSINPTADPTNILTDIPTTNPSEIPTNGPSIEPTYNPTISPSVPPTNAPSFSPSDAPTGSPTYCRNAKYRHKMLGNTEDCLWANEFLISPSCKYWLQMMKNGNLILFGNIDNLNLQLWMTDTKIFNNSGESVPKLIVTNDVVSIIEYTYKNVGKWGQKILWKIDKIFGENVILELNDLGCLILIDVDNDEFETTIIWQQCVTTTQSPSVSVVTVYETTDDFDSDEDGANVNNFNSSDKRDDLWWVWLLIIVAILGLFVAFFILRPYCHSTSNQTWITADKQTEYEHEYEDEDSHEHETDQIDKWMKETEMGNMETNTMEDVGEIENGNGDIMFLGNVEIMSSHVVYASEDYVNDAEMVFNS